MAKDNDNSFFHIHNGPCMNNKGWQTEIEDQTMMTQF